MSEPTLAEIRVQFIDDVALVVSQRDAVARDRQAIEATLAENRPVMESAIEKADLIAESLSTIDGKSEQINTQTSQNQQWHSEIRQWHDAHDSDKADFEQLRDDIVDSEARYQNTVATAELDTTAAVEARAAAEAIQTDVTSRHNDIVLKHDEVEAGRAEVASNKLDIVDRQDDIIARQADVISKQDAVVQKHNDVLIWQEQVASDKASTADDRQDVENRQTDIISRQSDVITKYDSIVTRHADITAKHSAVEADRTEVATHRQDVEDRQADIVTRQSDVVSKHTAVLTAESQTIASASSAASSETKAQDWAEKTENTEVEPGKYSAKHWARLAETYGGASVNALTWRGVWDASSNTAPPTPTAPETADFYKISVGGVINGVTYTAGDSMIWDMTNDLWFKIDSIERPITDDLDVDDSGIAGSAKALKILNESKANNHDHPYRPDTWVPAWSDITGIPASFTPEAHNHDDRYYTETEIDSKLASKSDLHTHPYRLDTWVPSWSEVTGIPTEFTPADHDHGIDDVTDLQTILDRKLEDAASDGKQYVRQSGGWAEVNGLPDQTGNNGRVLTTDGTNASWGDVDLAALENRIAVLEALLEGVTRTGDGDTAVTVFEGEVQAKDFSIGNE